MIGRNTTWRHDSGLHHPRGDHHPGRPGVDPGHDPLPRRAVATALMIAAGLSAAACDDRREGAIHVSVIGEKLEFRRFAKFEGAYVASYLHKSDPDLVTAILTGRTS